MQSVIQHSASSFRGLPIELILEILSYLPPEALISFGFANYHLFITHSVASLLSESTMIRLMNQAIVLRIRTRTRTTGSTPPPTMPSLTSLPSEVHLQILQNMDPTDVLNYGIANYLVLAQRGIAPALSQDTLRRLQRAVRRRQRPDSYT
ncbi:hypothetical protein KCU62_g5063, partial [Aureobasidium sp. EXF-3399]